ncbi:alpha/beta hydrolase [Frateuria aurantia]
MSTAFRRSCLRLALSLAITPATLPAAQSHNFNPLHAPSPQIGPDAVGLSGATVTRLEVTSHDRRRYVLWVVALGHPPRAGYPTMFLLDGHAAIQSLSASKADAPPHPVLLVAVGTTDPAYFDVTARAYDYTPDLGDGRPVFDPRAPQRRAGGAEAFLATLRGPVQAALQAHWPLDPAHRGLWGHSYGGLFALYTLLRYGEAFQFYAPTSPSLWWHAPLPRQLVEGFGPDRPGASACVRLSNGSAEGMPGMQRRPPSAFGQAAKTAIERPPFGDGELAQELRPIFGRRLLWQTYPGLTHGETFSASLGPAIRSFAAWSAGAAPCGFRGID